MRYYLLDYPSSGAFWVNSYLRHAAIHKHNLYELEDPSSGTFAFHSGWGSVSRTFEYIKDEGLDPEIAIYGATHEDAANLQPYWTLDRDKSKYRGCNVVLMVREPKDIMTSLYQKYENQPEDRERLFQSLTFPGGVSEFIRSERVGIRKLLTWWSIWAENISVPDQFYLLRYEEMRKDPWNTMAPVFDMMNLRVKSEDLRYADKQTGRELLELYPGHRGYVGRYEDFLANEDQEYIDHVTKEIGCPFWERGVRWRDGRMG